MRTWTEQHLNGSWLPLSTSFSHVVHSAEKMGALLCSPPQEKTLSMQYFCGWNVGHKFPISGYTWHKCLPRCWPRLDSSESWVVSIILEGVNKTTLTRVEGCFLHGNRRKCMKDWRTQFLIQGTSECLQRFFLIKRHLRFSALLHIVCCLVWLQSLRGTIREIQLSLFHMAMLINSP